MVAYFLGFAARTLARRTLMFWGHGVTSGIQQGIDYFVSSKLFHTTQQDKDDDDDVHIDVSFLQESYTEKLYLHDSLTVAFQRPPTVQPGDGMDLRALLGVQGGDPHYYLAPTSLYKFHPLMDRSMSQLLMRDARAIIVLVGGASSTWSDRIVARIRRQLSNRTEAGNNARQRIVVVPAMPRKIYLTFLASGSVVMLPFPTTSSVTVFETISVGTPFVSYAGSAQYMLQHYAPGILQAMGVNPACCIARSEEEYVDKLLRFGNNQTWRRMVSDSFRNGSQILFGRELKEVVVVEWEDMLRKVLALERV